MSKTIVTSVLGALFIDGKILLVKRRDIPVWTIPGGGIEPFETPEEAIIREIKEETGINAMIGRKVALYTSSSVFITPVYLFTLLPKKEVSLDPQNSEVREMGTFSIDALPHVTAPFQIDWIKDAFENKPYFEKHITTITPRYACMVFLKHPIIGIRFLLMHAKRRIYN